MYPDSDTMEISAKFSTKKNLKLPWESAISQHSIHPKKEHYILLQ